MPERVVRDGDARRSADPPAAAGLRRPVVAGVVGKAAEAATLVLLATVVPRLLGPADYGRLSVVLTLVAVGSVALTLGGATLLSRYVPAAPAQGRRGPGPGAHPAARAQPDRALRPARHGRRRAGGRRPRPAVGGRVGAAGARAERRRDARPAGRPRARARRGLVRAVPGAERRADRGGGGALRHGRGERRDRRGRRRGRRGARARPDGHGVALARGTGRTGAPADGCRPVRADGGGDRVR